MAISLRPLNEQVIVITGASSGIGLATALAAAGAGAKLVLAARNKAALREIESQIQQSGGEAIGVVADVGVEEDVKLISDTAISRFGGFDTWVNNAGISIYGKLEQVSHEDSHRLFQTNFWGVVYGSLTAIKHLKQKGGVLINVGSEVSDIAIPLQGMYSASKHAVKGFTDALRVELMEEKAPVSVTLIKPAGIDTPYPLHAKNYTGKAATLPPPVYLPDEVAKSILHAAIHPHRDIYVGAGSKIMSSMNKRMPWVMDWVNSKIMTGQQLRDEAPVTQQDSLHGPSTGGQMRGNHKGYVMKTSLYTKAALHPVIATGLAVAAGAGVIAIINKNSSKNGSNRRNRS